MPSTNKMCITTFLFLHKKIKKLNTRHHKFSTRVPGPRPFSATRIWSLLESSMEISFLFLKIFHPSDVSLYPFFIFIYSLFFYSFGKNFIFIIYILFHSPLLFSFSAHALVLFPHSSISSSNSPSGSVWFSRKISIFRKSSHFYCTIWIHRICGFQQCRRYIWCSQFLFLSFCCSLVWIQFFHMSATLRIWLI